MPDYTQILNVMKQAGKNATEAGNPVNVCFGKVTSTSPIKILVEQKITLGKAQLVLTRNVTDYSVNVTVDWETNTSLDVTTEGGMNLSHGHDVKGKKKMTIHNALQKGDEVLLLRVQGGQKYIVMDRVG